MTAIPDSKTLIQIEETDYRSAVSESTMTKIGAAVNYVINNSTFALGDVIQSMLTVAQFQTIRGSKWVLMDGQSVVGSDYETFTSESSVPDLVTNNRFLRQATNDGAIGTTQSSANLSHNHTASHSLQFSGGLGPSSSSYRAGDPGSASPMSITVGFSGGSEARPHNMQINHFIKINN